jgi:hypothetical protein
MQITELHAGGTDEARNRNDRGRQRQFQPSFAEFELANSLIRF